MAAVLNRSDKNQASSTSVTITTGGAYASGTSIIVVVAWRTGSTITSTSYTVSDPINGSYAQDVFSYSGNNGGISIFSVHNIATTASGTVITITGPTNTSKVAAIAMNWSGLASSSTFDKSQVNPAQGTGSPSGTTYTSNALATATAQANELLIGGLLLHYDTPSALTTGGSSLTWSAESNGIATTGGAAGSNAWAWAQYTSVSSTGTYTSAPSSAATRNFRSAIATYTIQSPPTVALNTPADTATGQSTTPTLNFTGTDPNSDTIEYNVQVDTVNTFNSSIGTVDSYASALTTGSAMASGFKIGQSFTGNGNNLTSVKFYLKSGGVTGNATAKVYAHSGTFGTSSVPTGAALATSDNFDTSTLTASYVLVTLNFTGGNQIALTNATNYVVTFENTSSGTITIRQDNPGTASGNQSLNTGVSWTANATTDVSFYVLATSSGPLLDKISTTDTGFTAGHPFTSGVAKDFTVQAGDTLSNNTTYYWRVRAIDPTGSNTYGAWSSTRSFTTTAGGGAAAPKRLTMMGVGS